MKKALVLPALLIVMALGYLIRNHTDYGEALPPGLPSDIPIIEGRVISGRRTLFEDGRGYVLDIQTDLSHSEVVEFYADRFENVPSYGPAPGMGAESSGTDFRLGDKRILVEIHSRETTTYITMAIHLGKWW
jgi:hypothetical protein